MKRKTKLTLTAIALTVALAVTACSKTNEILYEPEPTTTTTKAEEPEETTTAETTTADTTTTTTAVEEITTTPAVTTTEATKVVETEPTPQQTESTVSSSTAVTTTTTTSVTTTTTAQAEPTDKSYLNLSASDVQYILDECARYAASLGYNVMTYEAYETKKTELLQKAKELYNSGISMDEAYEQVGWYDLKEKAYVTEYPEREFWEGNWNFVMYAGNFQDSPTQQPLGYDSHCSTKQESIEWILEYLKYQIRDFQNLKQGCSAIGTKLKTFDALAQEYNWAMAPYQSIRQEYAGYDIFDSNTSYAFSVRSSID